MLKDHGDSGEKASRQQWQKIRPRGSDREPGGCGEHMGIGVCRNLTFTKKVVNE